MDHSKAAKGKETKKDLSIGDLLDKIIENLDNSLGLVSRDYCAQAISSQILGDPTKRTAGRFIEIGHKILQTDFYSSKETGLTDDELELTVLMYFAIAQDLKEKALPGANYYYDLAYHCHPIEDLALNPYTPLYARSLNTISPHSHLELQRIIALYSEISRVQFSMEAALAEVKLALLNNKTFANVKLDLDALLIKYPPLASSINAEKAWTELCDYAKNLRSKNPSIQALLDYLRQTTVLDYPSIKQDQSEEDLKLANEDDDKKLLALLDVAKKSRNTNPPITDIINSDKTAEALRIYYGPITEENVNSQKAALNLVQSLRKNNCNSFYYFYQNYDALSKNRTIIQLCRGSILQETPPIYFLEMAAWNGNREAQYELSKHYLAQHLERGAEDISLKGKWSYFLELAANNNVAEAQYDLSVAIKSKKISTQDDAEFLYLHDASSNGHQIATEECVRLQEYIEKIDLSKISEQDFKLLSDTSNSFNSAALRFAYCLENGFGTTQDLKKAYEVYEILMPADAIARFRFIAAQSKSISQIQEPEPFFELSDPKLSSKIIYFLSAVQQSATIEPQKKYILASEIRQLILTLTDSPAPPSEETLTGLSTANELAQALIDQYAFETSKTKDKDLVQPKTSGQETIKIALAELGKKLEDPLGFVDHGEHSKILILELLEKKSPSTAFLLSNYLIIAKKYSELQTADPSNDKAIKKAQEVLNSFLYYAIYQSNPDLDYYAELAYKCNPEQDRWNIGITYNYARFLEKSSQNSKEKKQEALNLYYLIIAAAEKTPDPSLSVVGLAKIKVAMLTGKSFAKIISSLKAIQKEYPVLIQNVEAEITWINLYDFAKKFRSPNDSKIQEFLDHANKVIAQEFPSLSADANGPSQEKELLKIKNREHLLLLFNRAIKSRSQFTSDIENNNIICKDRGPEFSQIIDSDELKPISYLRSLINKDPDALYYFYLNYDHCTSPKSESFYKDINLKLYQGFAKRPKEQFLREAALNGNAFAQYDLAQQSLSEAKELKKAITLEQNPDELIRQNKKLETLKSRFKYFLELSANNNHKEAILKIADCLVLNDDPANHDRLDRITTDPAFAFIYYKQASKVGNKAAKTKYEQELARIESLNLREISADDFLFIKKISHHDHSAMMIYAICLEGGLGTEQDLAAAIRIYKYLSPHKELARFKIALANLLETNNPESLILILQNTAENPDSLSYLAAFAENESFSPEIKYNIACELNKLSFAKKQKKEADQIYKRLIQNSASKGFVAACIEFAKILILQSTKQDEDPLANKKKAFAIVLDIINGNNSDTLKAEAAQQMLALLKTEDLLSADLAIEKIKPLLVQNFLTSLEAKKIDTKQTLGSTIQFKLAEKIEQLAQKIAEPNKKIWHQQAIALTKLSVNARTPYLPAQAKIILYFINGEYNSNIAEIKEFRKWCKSHDIKNPLAIANRLYEIGKEITEESVLQRYKDEFKYYFELVEAKLATKEEKSALKQQYPEWIKPEIEKIIAMPSATAKAASPAASPKATSQTISPKKESPPPPLALPILAPIAISLAKEPSRQQEMEAFLKERRKISSMQDLPIFLQKILAKMPQESKFWIKGSVISCARTPRLPNDLDIAFEIKGMSSWDETQIKAFVKDNFGIDKVEIYNRDGVFTVNAKDSAIDISFYSDNKKPPLYLDWTTNRDITLSFHKDGTSYKEYTAGFQEYLTRSNPQMAHINSTGAFLINPIARGLISRLCFLIAIKEITPEEIILAIGTILPNHPADLLFREFKLDKCNPEERATLIQEKITQFADNHKLNPELTQDFTFHLGKIINLDWSFITKQHPLANPPHPSTLAAYQEMYKTIDHLVTEIFAAKALANIPASSTAPINKTTLSLSLQNEKGRPH